MCSDDFDGDGVVNQLDNCQQVGDGDQVMKASPSLQSIKKIMKIKIYMLPTQAANPSLQSIKNNENKNISVADTGDKPILPINKKNNDNENISVADTGGKQRPGGPGQRWLG